MPPTALTESVRVFTGRVTAVRAEAIFTAKSEPTPENIERKRFLKGFSLLKVTARVIMPQRRRKVKIM